MNIGKKSDNIYYYCYLSNGSSKKKTNVKAEIFTFFLD